MYEFSLETTVLLIGAGVLSGGMNVIAGGGSLLTLPALMLLGLDADVANGTNRISVVAQSASTVHGFHRAGELDLRAAAVIWIPAGAGALAGAASAAVLDPDLLKPLMLGAMGAMAVVLAVRPTLAFPDKGGAVYGLRDRPLAAVFFVLAGFYGGFAQAGVGFLVLAVLGPVLRYDMVRANAIKMTLAGLFGVLPLVVFLLAGKVLWTPGLVLAAATVVGSRIGVRFALTADMRLLRGILLVCVGIVLVAAFVKG